MADGRWKPGVDDDADNARESGVHDQLRVVRGNWSGGRAPPRMRN
jgi:hypothetical protein